MSEIVQEGRCLHSTGVLIEKVTRAGIPVVPLAKNTEDSLGEIEYTETVRESGVFSRRICKMANTKLSDSP